MDIQDFDVAAMCSPDVGEYAQLDGDLLWVMLSNGQIDSYYRKQLAEWMVLHRRTEGWAVTWPGMQEVVA